MPRVRDFDTPLSDDDEQRSDADTVRRFAPTAKATDAPPQADVSGPAPEGGRTVPPPNGHAKPPDWRDLYSDWATWPVQMQEDTDRAWGKSTLVERERFYAEALTWREGLAASVKRAGFNSAPEYLDFWRVTRRREDAHEERQREREAAVADMPDEVGPPPPLSVGLDAAMAELTTERPDPYLISRFVVNNGLTIIAGHPKSMKSLGLLQAGFSFAARQSFLGMAPLGKCWPMFWYVTEEGSRFDMGQRLQTFAEAYPEAGIRFRLSFLRSLHFDRNGFDRVAEDLRLTERSQRPYSEQTGTPIRLLMALDPLRDFVPPGAKWSENDAQDMGRVKEWCRNLLREFPWLSIVLVHHLRKAAEGSTGLEMAGSGATYGAVDSTVVWKMQKRESEVEREEDDDTFDGEEFSSSPLAVPSAPTNGKMNVELRGDAAWWMRWSFNPVTRLFQRDEVRAKVGVTVEAFIRDHPGTTASIIATETGSSQQAVSAEARRLRARGAIVTVGGTGGRGKETRYYEKGAAPEELFDDDIAVDPLHTLD